MLKSLINQSKTSQIRSKIVVNLIILITLIVLCVIKSFAISLRLISLNPTLNSSPVQIW